MAETAREAIAILEKHCLAAVPDIDELCCRWCGRLEGHRHLINCPIARLKSSADDEELLRKVRLAWARVYAGHFDYWQSRSVSDLAELLKRKENQNDRD